MQLSKETHVNRICTLTLMGVLFGAAALNAQNPLSSDLKNSYTGIKGTIMKAAALAA